MSKYNEWWNKIFDEESIIDRVGNTWYFDITANEIKSISWREPRLMTKVDYRENLPKVMKKNWLSILAIKNGTYRISEANPFLSLEEINKWEIKIIKPDMNFQTIDPFKISSESQALDISCVNWILDEVFWEETKLTVRWRLRNEMDLNFNIGKTPFKVSGVQIEVDGGYEWANSLNLMEAKIGMRNNINIRQILYPELYWSQKISNKKINSFLMCYEEPYFYFIKFKLLGDFIYEIDWTTKIFTFEQSSSEFDIHNIKIDESLINKEAPFPQADDFNKVLAMLTYIWNWINSKDELFNEFDLNIRQIDYYYSVLSWMNLCSYAGDIIILSKKWELINKKPSQDKIKELSQIIFSNKIFNDALNKWVDNIEDRDFEKWRIQSWSTTIPRRKRTVNTWVEFFKEQMRLYN